MNFQKLFSTKLGPTPAEAKTLRDLDESTEPLKAWKDKVSQAFPATAEERKSKIQALAVTFANKPDPASFEELKRTATLGQYAPTGRDDRNLILEALGGQIVQRMAPQGDIIRAVIRRSAEALEKQMREVTAREKKECDEVGIPWQASGVVMALQAKVLDLRNRGAKESFGHWKDELADLL